MVKSCHKCGFKSYGRCGNGCPKILRLQSPKDKDFRLICFRCFQKVAEEKTERFQKHYLEFNERLQRMQAQLDAVHAASAPKNAKHSEEPEACAAAASTAKTAKHSEEPEGVLPWSDEPPPAKKRRQESLHHKLRSLKSTSDSSSELSMINLCDVVVQFCEPRDNLYECGNNKNQRVEHV